jgi:hypothetical protein
LWFVATTIGERTDYYTAARRYDQSRSSGGRRERFRSALLAAKPTFGTQIADAREHAEYFDYEANMDMIDFARLVRERAGDPGVQASATGVEETARAEVVKSVSGIGHPNAHGIALYIPSPSQYRRDDIEQANGFGQRYTELLFAKDAPVWQSFLTQEAP